MLCIHKCQIGLCKFIVKTVSTERANSIFNITCHAAGKYSDFSNGPIEQTDLVSVSYLVSDNNVYHSNLV